MAKNKGIDHEEEFVEALDNHKLSTLNSNLRNFVQTMFPKAKDNDIIHSELIQDNIKPDFSVTVNNETKYVSLKTGVNVIFHQEFIQDFCKYLRDEGISNNALKTILIFQYGDGTLDGSAPERMSYSEIRYRYEKYIKATNEELNDDPELVKKVFYRAVIKGRNHENIEADYLYQGDTILGKYVSKEQLMHYIENGQWDFFEALHFGPLLFRPHARYYKKKIKNPSSRHKVEIYWPNFHSDLTYILKHSYKKSKYKKMYGGD